MPAVLQLPIGNEADFLGVIDLITMTVRGPLCVGQGTKWGGGGGRRLGMLRVKP